MDADTDRCKSAFQLDSSQKRLRFPPEPKQVIRPGFSVSCQDNIAVFVIGRGAYSGASQEGQIWLWQGEHQVHREWTWHPRRHFLDN